MSVAERVTAVSLSVMTKLGKILKELFKISNLIINEILRFSSFYL
jgi:hypothetical protein